MLRFCSISIAIAVSLTCLTTSQAAPVLITFDEGARAVPYAVGEVFVSEGAKFEVDQYNSNGTLFAGTAEVGPLPFGVSPGSGAVAYPANTNFDIDFANTVGQRDFASVQYTNNGGSVNLLVNGVQTDLPLWDSNTFMTFDGTTINGVDVSVFDLSGGTGNGRGRLDFSGPIDRLVLGGQETIFDNIRTTGVPEPATFSLVCLVIAGIALRRRVR